MKNFDNKKKKMDNVAWVHKLGANLWRKSGRNFQNFCDLVEKKARQAEEMNSELLLRDKGKGYKAVSHKP